MKIVKHETNIDTIAIQLDFKTDKEQRNKFSLIYSWIIGRGLGSLKVNKQKSNHRVNVYDLVSGNSKLATLHTSFSKNFYIRIRWCGLKSFKLKHDEASFVSLMTLCAFLNTTGSSYRFVELDIALDLFCPFKRVLTAYIKPINNVPYNPVGYVQYFNGVPTIYIEDYSDINKRRAAFKRCYQYDKSSKEGLDFFVTRSELKLQNRFFLRYGFSLESIIRALDSYAVFYFNNLNNNNMHRVSIDISVVADFIGKIETVHVDFYGNVVVPLKRISK